jgi:hypothetical protein
MLLIKVDYVIQKRECTFTEDAKTILNWIKWKLASLNCSANKFGWKLLLKPIYQLLKLLVNQLLALSANVAFWENIANKVQTCLNQFLRRRKCKDVFQKGEPNQADITH